MTSTLVRTTVRGGVGTSPIRPDGVPKVKGEFAYSSDINAEGMLWGATVRSPHAKARIESIDIGPALAIPGVRAVLTIDDVPGARLFGLEHRDQPVLADGTVEYWGQPVAVVAADDPTTAKHAAASVVVSYEELDPLTDPEDALAAGSVFRTITVRRGDPDRHGSVVVEGYYEVAMQDQAPLGTESGLAIPDGEGGVDLHISTQWLHADHEQIIDALGLRPEQVRVHLAGIGGAFGAREDVSLQIHLCLLALHTERPVKMVYDRAESFVGHVHRHPAHMWYRHEATPDGQLVRVEAKLVLDGGAFASTSSAVIANASYFAVGPYSCDNVFVDGFATRTNNPPCGAMRGFGAVQACFGYESQMDRLAAELGMDPVEVRLRNALEAGGTMATTGQTVPGSLPTKTVIETLQAMPLPDPATNDDPRQLPGGTGLTTAPSHVKRGVGLAVSLKNLAFSEGFDDYAEARAVLAPDGVEIHTAAAEVGQGLVTVLEQIGRSATGVENVRVVFNSTAQIGSAGSTSASRQTQMTGGAALAACEGLAHKVLEHYDADRLDDEGVWREDSLVASLAEAVEEGAFSHHERFRHPRTEAPDEHGQGDLHAGFAVAAHRATVDVDEELGLVRVVQIDTVQDVGKALNPASVIGQIEGGIMMGVGLAVMEEIILDRGIMRNASFTDYLLPTFLDAPHVEAILIEEPDHFGPFGAKGVGEPPTISSTAAIVAAIRNATGKALYRAPVRPEDIIGL